MTDPATCQICGGELPADLVETTTVATIDPIEASICGVCQLVQDHSQPEGHCMECGDVLDFGYYIEIEYPCGVGDFFGKVAGSLCGDCAARHAFQINSRGVENDEEASEQYTALVDKQAQARREIQETSG